MIADLAQQLVPLPQDLVEALQRAQVAPAHLAVGDIEITPAANRRARHQLDILGGERDDVDLAYKLEGTAGQSIDAERLAYAGASAILGGVSDAQKDFRFGLTVWVGDEGADAAECLRRGQLVGR